MEILVGEEVELLAVDLLLVENVLVVHLLEETWIFDAIGLEELQVGHLERLTNGLSNKLGLQAKRGPGIEQTSQFEISEELENLAYSK